MKMIKIIKTVIKTYHMIATSNSNSLITELSALAAMIFFTATSVPLKFALNTSPLANNNITKQSINKE